MATSSISGSNASALAGSGTLSSTGLGSGLDISGIVTKLMAIERRPIDRIETKSTVIEAQLTAYGTLKGTLSSLQTSVQTLSNKNTFLGTKTSVGDSTLFTATSDSTAGIGSHTVKVEKLAKAQTVKSAAFANATDSVGTGTLTFDFGTYSTADGITSFAPNVRKRTVTVTIPTGADSLSSIASAVNSAKAGISATVLNDGTSNYLSFSPSDPGTANALRIQVSDNDGNNADASGLSRLAFDKSTGKTTGSVDFTAPTSVDVSAALGNNKFNLARNGGGSVEVTLADGTYTNANIVAALQTAVDTALGGAGLATVALDASNRLVIGSTTTSGTSSIDLSAAAGNTGLTALFGSSGTAVSAINRMSESSAPQDAKIWIDGVAVSKSSNVITDALTGVTISLLKESATETSLAVAADNSGIGTAIEAFVKAYNSTSSSLAELLSYNVKTGKAGALQSEGTVRSIQAQLRGALQATMSASGVRNLSEIGVSINRDGSLSFNSAKLQTALTDGTKNLKTFFVGNDSADGVAKRFDSLLTGIVGATGTMASRTNGLNDTLSAYDRQKSALETRMTSIENRYRKQFNNLDRLISSMNQTSNYLTQQLANLPGSGSNSKK